MTWKRYKKAIRSIIWTTKAPQTSHPVELLTRNENLKKIKELMKTVTFKVKAI